MRNKLLLGLWRLMIPVPRMIWQRHVSIGAQGNRSRTGFMSEEHHQVRDFVVRELPRAGKPLSPESISRGLNMPIARVNVILEELEKHMTFLFRDGDGSVLWAYPVTVERTPHRVIFSTGEQVHAA